MKKFNFKKTAASIAAFTLVLSAAVSPNASLISELIPVNSISASAATELTSGNWKYVETGTYTCEVTGYTGTAAKVTIPVAINGHSVTSIAAGTFDSNKTITYVAIPKGVTEIKNNTFRNASNLTTVILPSGISKIGNCAFQNTNISSISLPSALTSIGGCAFENTKLTSVNIPSAVKYINAGAFSGTPITSITIPENVTSLCVGAFEDCTKLKTVSLPSSLTKIYGKVFKGCTSLTSFTIPASVTLVGESAFANCTNLSSVKILGTPSFKSSVFASSNKLKNVDMNIVAFENAVKGGAFKGSTTIESINSIKLVGYYSYGRPYFASKYRSIIVNNFASLDSKTNKTTERVGFFDKYLKDEIKYIATTQTANCTTDTQKAKALHDWICEKVVYDYDTISAVKNHVDSSVFLGNSTVCDGYARGYTLLLQSVGIEAYYLSSGSHAWTMAKLGGKYFHIDVCHDDGATVDYSHYLKSDTGIKKCTAGHDSWIVKKPSYLYNYAESVTTPVCSYSLGDINKDGKVDDADQNYLLNYIVGNKGYTISASDKVLADTNFDGIIDICDATAINKFKD